MFFLNKSTVFAVNSQLFFDRSARSVQRLNFSTVMTGLCQQLCHQEAVGWAGMFPPCCLRQRRRLFKQLNNRIDFFFSSHLTLMALWIIQASMEGKPGCSKQEFVFTCESCLCPGPAQLTQDRCPCLKLPPVMIHFHQCFFPRCCVVRAGVKPAPLPCS